MDPRQNPYAPGAGTPPPELAGRNELIERAAVALDRIRAGRSAQSLVLEGLRGVGKTVLLNRIRQDAEARGIASVRLEASKSGSLAGTAHCGVARHAATAESRRSAQEQTVERDASLGGYCPGPESNIRTSKSALLPLPNRDLRTVATGLPQLIGQTGRARSYAERLFKFVPVDCLDEEDAREAMVVPAAQAGVSFSPAAIDEILQQTGGHPYFRQAWGKHNWDIAGNSPITLADTRSATTAALAELDARFFRMRFDRLTPAEKRYLRGMAELGPGLHRSGDIAHILQRKVTTGRPPFAVHLSARACSTVPLMATRRSRSRSSMAS